MSARVEKLLREVAALSPDEKRQMLRRIGEGAGDKAGDIRALKGLGRDVWRSIEANAYIDAERDSWERSTG